jgi:hypothetical protein
LCSLASCARGWGGTGQEAGVGATASGCLRPGTGVAEKSDSMVKINPLFRRRKRV